MKKTRILIADDHNVVRSGLRLLLKGNSEFSIVGEASDGEEALRLSAQRIPDIVIMDISMPKLNGIEATRLLKQRHPSIKVLILTIYENEEYVYQMIRAGANGYLLKNANRKELFNALRAVARGERFFSPSISNMMIEEFIKRAQGQLTPRTDKKQKLTKRETEILGYIAHGLTNNQIAEKLHLSVRTVNTHRSNLMYKLNIHDVTGLVRFAIEAGLLSMHSTA